MTNKRFSEEISVFHGLTAPEPGLLAGYGAVLWEYDLQVPLPAVISLISAKNRQYIEQRWRVMPNRYAPGEDLYAQLIFALKYEGVNLLLLKKLYEKLGPQRVKSIVEIEPLGQYSRRLWFFYEWLMEEQLDIPDLTSGNYTKALDEAQQFAILGERSRRHRVVNNLPGTVEFCPLTTKTEKLKNYVQGDLSGYALKGLSQVKKDTLLRASAFLLLKDSKASFAIEGESPKSKRMARWGEAIGQAGGRELTRDELLRLQQVVIENPRFLEMGFRTKGGFVGAHDRATGAPLPEHISARWQDVESLIDGILETNGRLLREDFDPIVAAAMISFGFVFVHPLVDGNGRIHRYLIHHVLSRKNFAPQGMIFPISASILEHIDDYRAVLESYSHPLLDFIDWEKTPDNNVEVLNETIDYYRYYDSTMQAEFLYDSVKDTIDRIIPEEVSYLMRFDEFKRFIDDEFEMPDSLVSMLIRFLEQNGGKLSKRARSKEFSELKEAEADEIERKYHEIFDSDQ